MSLPVGIIMPFAADSLPDGWLLCDGQEVPIAQYRQLSDAIGTNFNTPSPRDGYFRLPDLRGRFIRGVGTDGSSGMQNTVFGEKLADSLQAHTHNFSIGGTPYYFTEAANVNTWMILCGQRVKNPANGQWITGSCNTDTGYGFAGFSAVISDRAVSETRPYNIAMRWHIKY